MNVLVHDFFLLFFFFGREECDLIEKVLRGVYI